MNRYRQITPQVFFIIYSILMPGKLVEVNAKDIYEKGNEYNTLGMQSLINHDFRLAEKYFLYALKTNPGNKYYYNNLSVVYMNLGRYSLSKKYLKKAIAIDPHYYKALSNMAISCFHLFEFRLAYHYYQRSMNANRTYTIKRFERDRVMKRIKEIHRNHPDKGELKLFLKYLENHKTELRAD